MSDSRMALEELWRKRVQDALHRYRAARETCSKAIAGSAKSWSGDGQLAITEALKAEAAAIEEYRRVLGIRTDLTVDGKMPPPE